MTFKTRMQSDWAFFFGCALLFVLLSWLNSGTLAYYAASLPIPTVSFCGYLLNIDHLHFFETFNFIDGKEDLISTLLLRRILYPLFAYPFMKALQGMGVVEWYILGGFAAGVVLHLISAFFLHRKLHESGKLAARLGLLLFISYPGIFYWIGMPYSYSWIVPGSIFAYLALDYASAAESCKRAALGGLLLGITFLGYDIWSYFLPAGMLALLLKRRLKALLAFTGAALLPMAVLLLYLKHIAGVPLENENSAIYAQIVGAYFTPALYTGYAEVLLSFPKILLHNFFFSNFLFLPLFFLIAFIWNSFYKYKSANTEIRAAVRLSLPECCLLFAVLLVFCFSNLAPRYNHRWQIRGEWIARLYQPVFVVFIFYCARTFGRVATPARTAVCAGTVLFNALVSLAPALNIQVADYVHHNFYRHSTRDAISGNLAIWGKRPLGFCMKIRQVRRLATERGNMLWIKRPGA